MLVILCLVIAFYYGHPFEEMAPELREALQTAQKLDVSKKKQRMWDRLKRRRQQQVQFRTNQSLRQSALAGSAKQFKRVTSESAALHQRSCIGARGEESEHRDGAERTTQATAHRRQSRLASHLRTTSTRATASRSTRRRRRNRSAQDQRQQCPETTTYRLTRSRTISFECRSLQRRSFYTKSRRTRQTLVCSQGKEVGLWPAMT